MVNLLKALRQLRAGLLSLVAVQSALNPSSAFAAIEHANQENPGSAIELSNFLAKDKSTILFIHSPNCGPCQLIKPRIEQLSEKNSGIKIVDVLLDSKSDSGINFMSPAGNEFEVYSVPTFIIYDQKGKRIARGKKAQKQVNHWLVEQGLEPTY